jgi:ferric-dicitrate binding protein FerR (iron transport regulator)
MENHNQYDEVLTRYLLNELNSAEEKEVTDWIQASKENETYFEGFKKTWNLLNGAGTGDIDLDKEWNYFRRVANGGEMIMKLRSEPEELVVDAKIRRSRRVYYYSAAAAIILLVVSLMVFRKDERSTTIVAENKAAEQQQEEVRAASNINKEVNLSETPRSLLLSDGSEVVLYNNSEVSYEKEFTGNVRSVYLKGKADFSVTKDKTKPFTVYSGDISTTVLGTKFTVNAYENSSIASVRLHEGKVIVKSTETAKVKLKKDYVLLPGQEIVYNRSNGEVFVRSFKPAGKNAGSVSVENIEMPEDFKGTWFMFNNQPLPDVFDQLQALYNVEIKYNRRDLDKMYFIGRFDQTDSIEKILEKISLLHELKISRNHDKYSVSK